MSDERIINKILSMLGDISKVAPAGIEQTGAGTGAGQEVPVQFRRYINDQTLSKLPRGLNVYRGSRGGLFIDIRQLVNSGYDIDEAENLVGGDGGEPTNTASEPDQPDSLNTQENLSGLQQPIDESAYLDEGDEFTDYIPSNSNELDITQDQTVGTGGNELLLQLGQELLKYGIEVVFLTNKTNQIDGKSLLGENVKIGGIKHKQQVQIIFCVDDRLMGGIAAKLGNKKDVNEEELPDSKESRPEFDEESEQPKNNSKKEVENKKNSQV